MKELLEIYTETKDFQEKSVNKFIDNASKVKGWNFDEIARYCYQNENGKNVLVEIQIPTDDAIKEGYTDVDIVAYQYEGNIEDYSAGSEIAAKTFNGDWNTAIEQMKSLVKTA